MKKFVLICGVAPGVLLVLLVLIAPHYSRPVAAEPEDNSFHTALG